MSDAGPYYRPLGMQYPPPRRRFSWVPIIIAIVFIVAALFLLVVLFYPASFGLASSSGPRYYPFGGIFVLFFILLVGFFILRVAFWSTRASRYRQRYGGGGDGGYGMNRPAMVARMRYARGEISREQYDQIMQDLNRRPGSPP